MFCYNRKLWEKSQIAIMKKDLNPLEKSQIKQSDTAIGPTIRSSGSQLSQRLGTALENALPGKEFWDICCDHGILGIHALKSQKFSEVNFVDQVPQIMDQLEEKIRKHVKKSATNDQQQMIGFNFYTCPAELLRTSLKGNICILGVGAEKINFILQEWLKLDLLHADRLILGPHKDIEWFCEEVIPRFPGYHLVKKIDILEKNRTRTILVLDKLL